MSKSEEARNQYEKLVEGIETIGSGYVELVEQGELDGEQVQVLNSAFEVIAELFEFSRVMMELNCDMNDKLDLIVKKLEC